MTQSSPEKYVLIGRESTQGTPVTADKDIGIVREVADALNREVRETESITQVAAVSIETGMEEVTETLTVEFQHGRLFEYSIGSVAHDDTDTPDIKHTFTVANSKPAFTMESGENASTDTVLTSAGNLIENLELNIELNGVLTMTVGAKGLSIASSGSASSGVVSSLAVYPHSLCTFSIDGSTVSEVQNMTIQVQNQVQQAGGLGSNTYQTSKVTRTTFRFNGQIGVSATTYQALAIANTAFEVKLNANNGVSAASGRREVNVELENCKFDQFEKVVQVGDLVFLNIAGIGTLKSCFTYDNITSGNWG